jgi:hypothetical protein
MAVGFMWIDCPIEGCNGEVIWPIDDEESNKWWIICVKCGKNYLLEVKAEGEND